MAYVHLRYFGRTILQCPEDDEFCVAALRKLTCRPCLPAVVRRYESEVIIVPVLLLGACCLVGACILWMVCRRKAEDGSDSPTGPSERGWADHSASRLDIKLTDTSADEALSQWQVPRERILGELRKIGQGRYGHIYQARLASEEPNKERIVVLKEMHESTDPGKTKEFLARIKFHALLGKHENVVEFLGCCTDRSPLYLLMESMNRGNLLNFLWMCRKDVMKMAEAPYDLTERQVYNVALQVTCGLDFLHQKGLIHGDIAARNVLLQDDFTVKLSGLQIPFDIQRSGVIKPHTSVPLKWQSPERLMKKPFTPKTDVWSFGVLLFEMITL
uniref:tyrosine-protein kinase STYK1-like n=1 Tax=Pristiophorus japonicus TaxID=55135 RepID=UPI00398E5EEB